MSDMPEAGMVPFSLVVLTGCTTVVLASALAFVFWKTQNKSGSEQNMEDEAPEVIEIDREQYPGGHLSIYYGSQTGTAESFAQQLEREGPDHGFFVHVIDLEDVTVEQVLAEQRRDDSVSKAVFLVATYGEGEPTDNSNEFLQNLKIKAGVTTAGEEEKKEAEPAQLEQSSLEGLEFCVFGLGNRQYEHYNAMGKIFNDYLERAGGKRVMELSLGDDDDDLEGDFENWKDSVLWPGLTKLYVKDASAIPHKHKEDELPDCPYVVEYSANKNIKPEKLSMDHVHGSSRHYFTAVECPVSEVRELRSSKDPGSTVHMEIDVRKAKDFSYQTADNLGVLPENDMAVVEKVANSLGLDLNAVFSVKAAAGHEWHGAPFPMPISVRECLLRYCDLTSAPRRSELKLLAAYAKDPLDKKALLRMSSKEGKAEYREKIMDAHVGLVDLLKLCPSLKMPLEHFLGFCPRLLPRYYTISSSSSIHPKSVHLTVAVTESTRKDGSVFRGVCSSHLAGLNPKEKPTVRVFCRESTFRLPQEVSRPILMVGPGTGIAPMRALLQERQYQRTKLKKSVGPNVLYFGCKNRTMDYLYEEELQEFTKQGDLHMQVAFSREQKEKVYVQHLIKKNSKDTWELVNDKGASIYICGGVKMGNDVMETLKEVCIEQGKMSPDNAKTYLSKLASEGRLVQELWA